MKYKEVKCLFAKYQKISMLVPRVESGQKNRSWLTILEHLKKRKMLKKRKTPKFFQCIQCGKIFPNKNYIKKRQFCSLCCYFQSELHRTICSQNGKKVGLKRKIN